MWRDIPYRTCRDCTHIEDCKNPSVNQEGHPVPPPECPKPEEIKLTQRKSEILDEL
jgi:hypothetical protein